VADPYPSTEFGQTTKDALAQAGTVKFPYPPPASGPLFIGINPDYEEELPSGSPHYFLRVVQTVSPRQAITRIVDLDDLRGVDLPTPSAKEDRPPRVFRTPHGIAKDIKEAKDRLDHAVRNKRGVYEVCLFEDAVIYVSETAPVYLRIQYEFGVTAAEAAENIEYLLPTAGCCDRKHPHTGGV
jgi:hypothetical protein